MLGVGVGPAALDQWKPVASASFFAVPVLWIRWCCLDFTSTLTHGVLWFGEKGIDCPTPATKAGNNERQLARSHEATHRRPAPPSACLAIIASSLLGPTPLPEEDLSIPSHLDFPSFLPPPSLPPRKETAITPPYSLQTLLCLLHKAYASSSVSFAAEGAPPGGGFSERWIRSAARRTPSPTTPRCARATPGITGTGAAAAGCSRRETATGRWGPGRDRPGGPSSTRCCRWSRWSGWCGLRT